MKSLSSVGLGLSLVFGCLFLALVAEVYYLLWWKKRITNRDVEDGYSSSTSTGTAKEFFYMFCWKKRPTHEILVHEPQAQNHQGNSNKDSSSSWAAHLPFGEDSVEADLLRLQHLSGPPRFLFTIKEETKEDLESEDGKSRGDRSRKGSRGRSLSDLFHLMETPYLTPMASPPYYTPPLTPVKASSRNMQPGFNGFFGSASEAEFNLFLSSPPPVFKFITDVVDDGDKQQCKRKSTEEMMIGKIDVPSSSTVFNKDEEQGSFITLIVNKKKQEDEHQLGKNVIHHCPSNTSQVLPLASSPPSPLKSKSTMS
ncbi:OLC1v1027656C2 [Oldenlandia corymbosa var. corymbosa]|uniref:OLC1v1027656C2 n=1 Tax=Oldenlandia corymbosa var. corymbosa TaxID=529605 RepID=A0AAV1CC85_OLDCO|nr:OLC1v1027656C2 [Oldenlandia corymbosa var. corymbosa]